MLYTYIHLYIALSIYFRSLTIFDKVLILWYTGKTINMKHKVLEIKNNKNQDVSKTSLTGPQVFNKTSTKVLNLSQVEKDPKNAKKIKQKKIKPKRSRKKLYIFLFLLIIILGILSALTVHFVVIPAQKVYNSAQNIQDNIYALLGDVKNKDISSLEIYLNNVKSEIGNINKEIDKFDILATWDVTKGYYDNFKQAQVILNKSDLLITDVLPDLKNLLEITGFKTQKTPEDYGIITPETEESTGESDEGAITLILKEMPRYLNLYNEIEPRIIEILQEFKKINPDYLPSIGSFDLKDNLAEINTFADEFPSISKKTVDFLKEMPQLLGSEEPTTYLLILQNETEMRASGGLLTAFGTVEVVNGEISDDLSLTDTWQLQYDMWRIGLPMPRNNIYGQAYLMNSGCGATEARVQDVAMYPDLYISTSYFREYYDRVKQYFPAKYPDYDHVLILNYAFSENLLELIQPLEVEGFGVVNAENLYNFIKNETDNPENFYDEDRKKIIKDLAKASKEKLLDLGIAEIPKVIDLIVRSFQAKDIALASKDERMQAYLDLYNMSGRSAQEFEGDYFQLNEAQNCSLKLNKFVRDTVQMNINIDDSGNISNSVHVKWLQPQIYDPSLKGQYSPTLQYSYRAWVRFFLPLGTHNILSDGFSRSGYLYYYPKTYIDSEMNKQVSDNIVQFDHRRFNDSDPIEKDEMNISYTLPENLNYNAQGKYRLLIQKHPGKSWGEKYTINISYRGSVSTVEFTLDRDKVITFKDGLITVDNYEKGLDWITELSYRIPWDKISESDTSDSAQE